MFTAALHGQAPTIRWAAGNLSSADQEQILELASRMGIKTPRQVESDWIMQPLGCLALRVESAPAVDGNRRTRSQIFVAKPPEATKCLGYLRDPRPVATAGSWQGNAAVSRVQGLRNRPARGRSLLSR
jgi:hypothetical protein